MRGAAVYTLQGTLGFVFLFVRAAVLTATEQRQKQRFPGDRWTPPSSPLAHHLVSRCPSGGSEKAMDTLLTALCRTTGCQSAQPLQFPTHLQSRPCNGVPAGDGPSQSSQDVHLPPWKLFLPTAVVEGRYRQCAASAQMTEQGAFELGPPRGQDCVGGHCDQGHRSGDRTAGLGFCSPWLPSGCRQAKESVSECSLASGPFCTVASEAPETLPAEWLPGLASTHL